MFMKNILEAIENGADSATFAALEIPATYRAAVVLKSEEEMFAGVTSANKDPRKSVHIQDVAVPQIAPDEVLIAVMASSINFNTVWSSIFEPISTFSALTLGICILVALVSGRRAWYYPPALLLLLTAVGRVIAWLLHDAALASQIGVEVVVAVILLVASRRLAQEA